MRGIPEVSKFIYFFHPQSRGQKRKFAVLLHFFWNFEYFIDWLDLVYIADLKFSNWITIAVFSNVLSWNYFSSMRICYYLENSYWECEENVGRCLTSFSFILHNVGGIPANKRLHLGSQTLHIPATLWATMWPEFHSHCEGQV